MKHANERRGLILWTLGATCAVPLTLAGCGNEDGQARREADERLETASHEATVLSLGEAYPGPTTEGVEGQGEFAPMRDRQAAFEDLAGSLEGGAGLPQQQAAQSALKADAGMGLAALQLEEARRFDADIQRDVLLAGRYLDAVEEHVAMLAAAEAFDPAPLTRQLDDLARQTQERHEADQTAAREVQERIADLEARIRRELTATDRLHEEAARKREQAESAALDSRIALIEEAAAVGREADAHQVAASELESQLDLVRPELARLEALVLQSETELRGYESARQRLDEQQAQMEREAAMLRDELTAARERFAGQMDALAQRVNGELIPQYERALVSAEAALTDAQRSGSGNAGRLASAQQLAGRIHWRLADSLETFLTLVERAAEAGDATQRKGDSDLAQTVRARMEAEKTAAEEALRQAVAEAEGISARGEEAEGQRERLVAALNDSIAALTGQPVAREPEPEPIDESAEEPIESEIPAVAGDPEGPRALLRTAQELVAAGQLTQLATLFHADSDAERQIMDVMGRVLSAMEQLDHAARDQFDVGFFETVNDPQFARIMRDKAAGNPMAAGMAEAMTTGGMAGGLPDLTGVDLDALEFSFDSSGTTAWVNNDEDLNDLNMVQVDGRWLFDMDLGAEAMPEGAENMDTFLTPVVTAFETTARRTAEGQYASQWDMTTALLDEIFAELMKTLAPEGAPGQPGGGNRGRNRDRDRGDDDSGKGGGGGN